jgi:hypothetical protein
MPSLPVVFDMASKHTCRSRQQLVDVGLQHTPSQGLASSTEGKLIVHIHTFMSGWCRLLRQPNIGMLFS